MAAGPFVEPDAVSLVTLHGEAVGDSFGWIASNLGDITGDGLNELITTAPFSSAGGRGAGKVYIYSGNGTLLHTIVGNPGDRLGFSATSAGDVNKDGTPDYIIGRPGGPRATPPFHGRAVVYSGANHSVIHELVAPLPDVVVAARGGGRTGAGIAYVLSGLNGKLIHTLEAKSPAQPAGQGTYGQFFAMDAGDIDHARYLYR